MSDQFTTDIPELRQLPGLATAAEVAAVLKCSKRHILSECSAGRIEAAKIAGRFLITPIASKIILKKGLTHAEKKSRRIP